jgi:phosphatidylserine/phosphatidylglycerophosphate/cardiolipin synthase-like enzyme
MKKSPLLLILFYLSSCSHSLLRIPSSEGGKNFVDVEKLSKAYKLSLETDQLYDRKLLLERNVSNQNVQSRTFDTPKNEELSSIESKIVENNEKLSILNEELTQKANELNLSSPVSLNYYFENNFRIQNEKLIIQNPENYKMLNDQIIRSYKMNFNNVTTYQLGVVNKVLDENENRVLEGSIYCDSEFKVKKLLHNKKISKNENYDFKLNPEKNESPKLMFSFSKEVGECSMTFSRLGDPSVKYGVKLINEMSSSSKINSLRNNVDVCLLPNTDKLHGVEKFFLTPNYQSMTCAIDIQDIKTLEVPIEGLKSKVEALLGQPIPYNFIESKNPFLDIDFSKAPKLNTILVSYLVFRADFYGNLMARLLKWHADHGTEVRILVSDVITLKKDKKMLNELQESSNNIKVQEFRYDSPKEMGLWDHLSEFHRTMHVKLFITLADSPDNNVVYFGGRNIHDGFVFKETPDHSKLPDLVQYGTSKTSDESYAHWRDFEMRIKSKELAERVSAHLLNLIDKDSKTFFIRSINQNVKSNIEADPQYFTNRPGPVVRHFMSIPYKDEHALEKFYVDMFDSAEKSIRLSTPYFRPTKILGEAMQRAVERGVEVSLITRIDLSGDTAAIILGEVNKAGINRFLNKIKIYEYTEPNVILHSKLVLIDGKFSFVGSVNLNKRSFVHDTENGIMVYDPIYNQKMNSIMDTYRTTSREVTEKQKIALWKRIVIGIFDTEL